MNKYPIHASATDRKCAAKLIDLLLSGGNVISVHNGECLEIKRSNNKLALLKAMAATGEDTLIVRNAIGDKLGVFFIIYNNGCTELELIVDHSCNVYCEAVYNKLFHHFDN